MSEPPRESPARMPHEFPWRDAMIAAGVTVGAFSLSAYFQFSETLYALTRRWEYLQVDELPTGLFALSVCMAWLSLKRYRQAYRELQARRIAEERLGGALAENRRLVRPRSADGEIDELHLTVSDNGCGMKSGTRVSRFGLSGGK
jgi:hypothetical protein